MNCCDYDCTQGRDCPARATDVARVGKQHPRHEPSLTAPGIGPGPVDDGEAVEINGEALLIATVIATALFTLGLLAGVLVSRLF